MSRATTRATRSAVDTLGWLFLLSGSGSFGLLLVALANSIAVGQGTQTEPIFWFGLLLIFVPLATRQLMPDVLRAERVGLVIVLIMLLYGVKLLQNPYFFMYGDEFLHVRNLDAILQNQTLFTENSVLPVSALYPGLEIVTAAFATLSGLPSYYAGVVLVGMARLLLSLSLFLFFEQVSRSARVAGVATVLYMCHSNFLFWSAQFSYESLSLPLIVAVLFVVMRRERLPTPNHYAIYTLVALLGIGSVVVTHHLSSYFLTAFLGGWWFVFRTRLHLHTVTISTAILRWRIWPKFLRGIIDQPAFAGEDSAEQPASTNSTLLLTLCTMTLALLWLFLVAYSTVDYLAPVLRKALFSIFQAIAREEGASRELFRSTSGQIAPLWERVIGIGSVLLALFGLPFGLLQVYRRRISHPMMLLLAVAALGYFGLLGLRFTPAAWESGNRAQAYLYAGLSFVIALALVEVWLARYTSWWAYAGIAGYISIIFMGGIIAGWTPKLRLAQPFLVDIGGQTIAPQGLAVAEWAGSRLHTADYTFATDEANGRLLLVYGQKYVYAGRNSDIKDILVAPELTQSHVRKLQDREVQYLLVDRRRASQDNMAGYFYERAPAGETPQEEWLAPEAYTKFDHEPDVDRILDSGDIVIYDLSAWLDPALTEGQVLTK